jgi:DNA replication protein DnaC
METIASITSQTGLSPKKENPKETFDNRIIEIRKQDFPVTQEDLTEFLEKGFNEQNAQFLAKEKKRNAEIAKVREGKNAYIKEQEDKLRRVAERYNAQREAEIIETARQIAEYRAKKAAEIPGKLIAKLCEGKSAIASTVIPALLPNRAAYEEALRWRPNAENCGLFLRGLTGSGKSRAAINLAKALIQSGIHEVEWLSALGFGRQAAEASRNGEETWFVEKYTDAKILIIDDLGQSRMTPFSENTMREIIFTRLDDERPIIVTTQFDTASLIERFEVQKVGEDAVIRTGEALARRLSESLKTINF